MKKTPYMRCVEMDRGQTIEALIAAGIEAGKSWGQIADDLGVTRVTLNKWVNLLGCEVETKRTVKFGSQQVSA